ncbi:hypothetical protein JCM10296v2_002119 [Rhodotorula toruloides]
MPPATRQSNRDRRYAFEGESSDGESEQPQASTSNSQLTRSEPRKELAEHEDVGAMEEDEDMYAESDGMAPDDDDFDPHADFDEVVSARTKRKGSRATLTGSRSSRAGAELAGLPALPRLRFAPPPQGGALAASFATPPRPLPLVSGPAPPKAAKRTLTFAGGRKGDPDKARPYVCHTEGCDKAFSRKSDLIRHERIHTDDRPYECLTCHKSFIQRSALTVHERVHTGERPHCCDTCQRSFSDSSSLARHRRVHTGARPYVCDVCGRDFCRKTTLTKHIAKVHDGSANNAATVVSRTRKRAVNTSSSTSQVRVGPLVRQYTYQQGPGAPYPRPSAPESDGEPDSPASLDRADLHSPFATPAHFASPEDTTPRNHVRTNVGGAGGWGHRRAATSYEDNHLPPIQTLVAPPFGRSNSMPNVPQVHEKLYSVDHFGHAYEIDEYGNALGDDVHLAPLQTPYQQHDHEQHAPHSAFPTYAPARAGARGRRLAAPERVDRSPSPMSAPPTANPAFFSARPSISYEVEDSESEAYDEVEMAHVQPHGNGSSAYAYRDEEDEHEQNEQEQHLQTPMATPFASSSAMPTFQQQPNFAPPAPGPSFSFSTYDRSTSGFASAPASHLRSPALEGLRPHSSGGMNATLAAHNPQTSPLLHHVPPTFSPQSPAKSYTTSMRYSPMLGRSGGYVVSPLLGGRDSSTGPTGSSSFFASPPTSHLAPPAQAGPSLSSAFSALTAPAPLASDRFARFAPPLHEESQYHQHHLATPASPASGRRGYSARRLPRMMDAESAGVGLGIEGVGRMEGSLREVNGWRDGAEDDEGREVVKEEPVSSEA